MSEEFKTTLADWRPGVPAPVWFAVICCGVFVVAPVFGAIGIAALTAGVGSKIVDERPKIVDERPSLRLNIEHLARLPVKSQLLSGSRFGRTELHQYGSIYNRDVNFALVMRITPDGTDVTSDSVPYFADIANPSMPHFSDVRLMRNARTVSSSVHYDLETRLGLMRATEVRVDNDGQWKQCLTFVSRFDSTALYMMGAYCDASGTKPSAGRLACMFSRVELDGPVPSREAETYLRERLEHAWPCSAQPVSQTIDTGQRRPSPPSRWSTPSAQQRY